MTALPLDVPVEITEPGVYDLLPEIYHSDPVPGGSLSSTGARKLLPPSCPAIFDWERRNPPAPSKAFDLGHAAHETVLGGGPELVVVPDEITAKDGSWSTKEAKAFVAEVRLRGAVPLKPCDMEQVHAMADVLRAHPFAGRLFAEGSGQPEASLFTRDEQTGVMLRSRLDWLPRTKSGRMIVPDLKTSVSAEPGKFMRSAADYGYASQAAWYCDLVRALELADDPLFVFVVQQKSPPYPVTVIQPDVEAMRIGALLNRRAIDLYARCEAEGRWPGFAEDVVLGSLPYWYARDFEDET